MPKTVTSTEAQNNFGAILQWADDNQDDIVIERRGKPAAVIVSYAEYLEIVRLRREEQKRNAWAKVRALREKTQLEAGEPDAADVYRAAGFSESVVQETLEKDKKLADAEP